MIKPIETYIVDDDGTELPIKIRPCLTMMVRSRRRRERAELIENLKLSIQKKCGTPLAQDLSLIRHRGEELGLDEKQIHQLCDNARELQHFRFFLSDKKTLRVIEILTEDLYTTYAEAQKISEDELEDECVVEVYSLEFFGKWKPELTPEQCVERWKMLDEIVKKEQKHSDEMRKRPYNTEEHKEEFYKLLELYGFW